MRGRSVNLNNAALGVWVMVGLGALFVLEHGAREVLWGHATELEGPGSPSADPRGGGANGTAAPSFDEFRAQYKSVDMLISAETRQKATAFAEAAESPGAKFLQCHRVDLPMRELDSVPVPREWCEPRGSREEDKAYIFLVGAAYAGTGEMLGMLMGASNVSNLCVIEYGRAKNQCEGLKFIVPDEAFDTRWQSLWPTDFRTEVLDAYEEMWNDKDRPIRVDQSPPWSVKVGQIVRDLVDRDGLRVAFVFMTRSSCSKKSVINSKLPLLAQEYEYLRRRRIPVLHVRYEDFPRDLPRVKQRLHEWARCISLPDRSQFVPLFEYGLDTFSGSDSFEDYMGRTEPQSMQLYEPLIDPKSLPALAYFGYTLEVASRK